MKLTTIEIEDIQPQIAQIRNLVNDGLTSLVKAGEIIVNLIESGYTARHISQASGFLTVRDVTDLQNVGLRKMSPKLMVLTAPSSKYLAAAPLATQEDILENGIEVMVEDEGKFVKKRLTLPELSHKQCKILFSDGRINSLAKQKKLLAENTGWTRRPNYQVENGLLVVNKACSFTKAELKSILASL